MKVNVFWTGGLDSTYRICELSLKNVEIQPYYCRMAGRASTEYELRAINTIRNKLLNNSDVLAKIHPVIVVDNEKIHVDAELKIAYEWVKDHNVVEFGLKRFPKQYLYLAAYCKNSHMECEVAIENEPHSRFSCFINKYGGLEKKCCDDVQWLQLVKDKTNPMVFSLLSYFHISYPLLNLSKLEEVERLKMFGFEDIIADTWFCHHPINGKPCGYCSPCRQVVAAGMSFRLPKVARMRHRFSYIYLLWNDKLKPLLRRLRKR